MVKMVIPYEQDYFTKTGYKPYQDFPAHIVRVSKIIAMTHPKSVLDMGCAYGYIVKRLVAAGIDAWGCDISEWCERQASLIIPGRFNRCSLDKLPFNDKQFDLTYCEGVLEHLTEEQALGALSEMDRVAHEHMIAVSFPEHADAATTPGHICLKDANWWFEHMPNYTWLFISPTGTQDGNMWLYKA